MELGRNEQTWLSLCPPKQRCTQDRKEREWECRNPCSFQIFKFLVNFASDLGFETNMLGNAIIISIPILIHPNSDSDFASSFKSNPSPVNQDRRRAHQPRMRGIQTSDGLDQSLPIAKTWYPETGPNSSDLGRWWLCSTLKLHRLTHKQPMGPNFKKRAVLSLFTSCSYILYRIDWWSITSRRELERIMRPYLTIALWYVQKKVRRMRWWSRGSWKEQNSINRNHWWGRTKWTVPDPITETPNCPWLAISSYLFLHACTSAVPSRGQKGRQTSVRSHVHPPKVVHTLTVPRGMLVE